MVKYTQRRNSQGCYQRENSIVILCAYLGQLAKIRDALASDVVVITDERDEVKLNEDQDVKTETLKDLQMKRVAVTRQVCTLLHYDN